MRDITEAVEAMAPVANRNELIWDEIRSNVILFNDGEPISYTPLDSKNNNEDYAVKSALHLLNGRGRIL